MTCSGLLAIVSAPPAACACQRAVFSGHGYLTVWLRSPLQEEALLQTISDFFQKAIPDVPFDDEAKFVEVLKEAGLTDG